MDPAIEQTLLSALGQCGEAMEDNGPDASYMLESLLDILALIALKPIVEGLEADTEHFCGAGFVAAGEVDRSQDQFAFDFVQRHAQAQFNTRARTVATFHIRRQVSDSNQ